MFLGILLNIYLNFHDLNLNHFQLLTGSLKIDYVTWLQTPISLNPERAWLHLSRRCDFQEDAKLTMPEVAMVASITKIMKKRKNYGK